MMSTSCHESRLHLPARNAHHIGCSWIAFTPRCLNRNATSCRRGSASERSPPGPVQKTSADAAARGQTIGSRFSGPDCSAHRACSPEEHDEIAIRVSGEVGDGE